jgi:hypothetical protein
MIWILIALLVWLGSRDTGFPGGDEVLRNPLSWLAAIGVVGILWFLVAGTIIIFGR